MKFLERPTEPEWRAAQRCRLLLRFYEGDERVDSCEHGWARIEGPWLHFNGDLQGYWQSWPVASVVTVEWLESPPQRDQRNRGPEER